MDMLVSTKLSEHFSLQEMANNEGDRTKPQYILNYKVDTFLKMVEDFRTWFNRPFTPNCSYRQSAYNKKVGGVSNSLHVGGTAIDIPFPNMTDAQWNNIIAKWKELCEKYGCVGEAGRYKWGFHLGAFVTYQKTFYIFDKRK